MITRILGTGIIAAVAMLIIALAPGRSAPVQATEPVPAECASMTFTKTIYVNSSYAYIPDSGVLLIFGRPTLPNMIVAPWATQACIVGGTNRDALSSGRGDDVLIGNGSTSTRDQLNGMGGIDTCYGPGVKVNCEIQP